MNSNKLLIATLVALTSLAGATSASAYSAPRLRSTAGFAVLSTESGGRGAITCTDSTIDGNVGSSGFPPAVVQTRCSITGKVVAPVATIVLRDAAAVYTELNANQCQVILTGTQAGKILAPGVYCFDEAAALTGTLTLNGPARSVWIFLVNGDMTGNNFSVVMAGGAQPCNVYWATSGATTMTTSNTKGTIVANQAITLTGGTFSGRAFAAKAATATNVAVTTCRSGL